MTHKGSLVIGVLCGCALAGGVAAASSSRGADATYPGLGIDCNQAAGQLSCFELLPSGKVRPLKRSVGVGISKKSIYVFKDGKAVYSIARTR